MNAAPPSQPSTEHAPTTGQRRPIGGALIILLGMLTGLTAMAIDMYLPAMPGIALYFNTDATRVQQTLAVFLGGLAVGQAVYGPLLDRYGRRAPLLAGIALFVAGSVMAALASSVEALLLARFVQALGAAAGLVTPRAIVTDSCSVLDSARIFSLLMQVMMIAPVVAPLLGGALLEVADWHLIFWVLAALGLVAGVWTWQAVPDSLPIHKRAPLRPRDVLRAYAMPMRTPAFVAYSLAGGFVMGSLFTYISASAFVFTEHYGLTALGFSYLFASNSLVLIAGGMLSNRLLARGRSAREALALGLVVHGAAAAAMLVALAADVASLMVYGSLLAVAVGSLGLILGNLTALTMAQAGRQAGTASALMGTWHYLLAAAIGVLASLAGQSPATLAGTVLVCALAALALCNVATRRTQLAPA